LYALFVRKRIHGDRHAAPQVQAERHALSADRRADHFERVERWERLEPDHDRRGAKSECLTCAGNGRCPRVEPKRRAEPRQTCDETILEDLRRLPRGGHNRVEVGHVELGEAEPVDVLVGQRRDIARRKRRIGGGHRRIPLARAGACVDGLALEKIQNADHSHCRHSITLVDFGGVPSYCFKYSVPVAW
jgi:hypothetical protein